MPSGACRPKLRSSFKISCRHSLDTEEAQIDFFKSKAPVRDPLTGRRKYPWVFRMTLSCSRHGYEEALPNQKAAAFRGAHEHAFLAFCGVPRVVRMNNTKTAVVRACLYDPDLNEL